MRVGITDNFDSAHRATGEGTEGALHGHTYRVEVVVQGGHASGMVVDFRVLKEHTRETLKRYDHVELNRVLKDPTVEGLARAIFDDLARLQPGLHSVKVWEGSAAWAEARAAEAPCA